MTKTIEIADLIKNKNLSTDNDSDKLQKLLYNQGLILGSECGDFEINEKNEIKPLKKEELWSKSIILKETPNSGDFIKGLIDSGAGVSIIKDNKLTEITSPNKTVENDFQTQIEKTLSEKYDVYKLKPLKSQSLKEQINQIINNNKLNTNFDQISLNEIEKIFYSDKSEKYAFVLSNMDIHEINVFEKLKKQKKVNKETTIIFDYEVNNKSYKKSEKETIKIDNKKITLYKQDNNIVYIKPTLNKSDFKKKKERQLSLF